MRLLANIPFEELVPAQGRNGVLELLKSSQRNASLPMRQSSICPASGWLRRPVMRSSSPLWTSAGKTSDHRTSFPAGIGPVVVRIPRPDHRRRRIGRLYPAGFCSGIRSASAPILGQLALPVFLLVYALLRRELRPMRQAAAEINTALHRPAYSCKSAAGDDFQEFMQNFKLFMQTIDQRFGEPGSRMSRQRRRRWPFPINGSASSRCLQSLPDALLVMDDSGVVTFANSKLAPLLGVSLTPYSIPGRMTGATTPR